MNIRSLRTVLLIQSIEESDRGGEVLPLTEREDATREAARKIPAAGVAQASQLSVEGERFVTRRADDLLARVRSRSPVVDHVLSIAQGTTWFPRIVLLLAFALGVGLSLLEGRHGISLFAFPLVGLAIWNILVYLRLRSPRRFAARWYQRSIGRSIEVLLKHSELFNLTLSVALKRFVSEWTGVARSVLSEKANALLHFAAVLVVLGFVAGLYLRGVGLHSRDGWENGVLPAWLFHTLLALIVIPRLLLALACLIKVARLSYRVVLPRSLVDYAFRLIAEADSASMRG